MTDLTNPVRDAQAPLCEEGVYPYPDGCVKLVIGNAGELDVHSSFQYALPMVVVTSLDDLANERFQDHHQDARPQTVDDLNDVRWQVQQLRELEAKRTSGWFLRWLFTPCMVVHRGTMGSMHRRFLLARNAVHARRLVIRSPYSGYALTLKELEALLARMERVKTGEEPAEYAWDYSEGGDFDQSLDRWFDEGPPEHRAWVLRKLEELKQFEAEAANNASDEPPRSA
ncbi:hypothetical protein SAMN05216466_106219 [Paraburkholderia phenazinium]|uniref:Uncharacterized protein n=1 Tax=Paraburkholderia phenazinium TaxID=60549 RepID=A0A1G7YK31_9BURK|nr:hypothetical protein [Paraburkholderia phenazinium]SDG96737.1 hypothetical protein SAMN05216466_106219 [Paraburkholderia phenazinium]